jgi:hypothetical protein
LFSFHSNLSDVVLLRDLEPLKKGEALHSVVLDFGSKEAIGYRYLKDGEENMEQVKLVGILAPKKTDVEYPAYAFDTSEEKRESAKMKRRLENLGFAEDAIHEIMTTQNRTIESDIADLFCSEDAIEATKNDFRAKGITFPTIEVARLLEFFGSV